MNVDIYYPECPLCNVIGLMSSAIWSLPRWRDSNGNLGYEHDLTQDGISDAVVSTICNRG